MYIAVIADNIANRKHIERLLDRTSDAIMSQTGNLYIEAYGEPASMWPSMKRYDLFLLDIQNTSMKEELLNRFTELGITNQVVVCRPEEEGYSPCPLEKDCRHVQHPLNTTVLSELVLDVHEAAKQKESQKRIVEIRSEEGTHYLEAETILYAIEIKKELSIYLTDNSCIKMPCNIYRFKRSSEVFEEFDMCAHNLIVNTTHIKKMKGRTITLSNDKIIKIPLFAKYHVPNVFN